MGENSFSLYHERGAIGSCLHQTEEGMWLAYSRWPDKSTRDASWPESNNPSNNLTSDIQQSITQLKSCIEEELPEITMDVINDLFIC